MRDELEHRVELDARSGASSPLAGSSSSNTVGSNATPRAISTRRCSPRDSSRKRRAARLGDAEAAQHVESALALPGRRAAARDVGAVDARQHDVERREIPRHARVTILQLVTDEHDLASGAHGVRFFAGAEIVAPRAALRRRPDRAGDQAEQRALAAAVRADDAPVLAAHELPRDVVQHRSAGEIDVDMVEGDERCGGHRSCAFHGAEAREFT